VFLRKLLRKADRMLKVFRMTLSCVLMVLLFSSTVCGEEEPAEAKTTSASEGSVASVTFVEIGSVKCIPCKMMQPIMDEIKKEYAGRVKVIFYDVSTPEGSIWCEKLGIRLIPTQVFLDANGNEFFRHEGFFPKEEIVKVLKQGGVE
jgi:thioredoxin 1